MKINIIDHKSQIYETCGDYRFKNGEWVFYISSLSSKRYEMCVILHEVIECYLCYWLGIKEEDISAFDIQFEKDRLPGNLDEPGDDINAPYRRQHQIATFFEKILAFILFVNWKKYDDEINNLEYYG